LAAVIIRPLPPTKSLYPAVNFFKDAYQVFDKIPQLEKKKPMFRMLESFTSGKWELSTFPFSTERERGNYCESFMPLSILDVMPLAKRNK
jgi:hypothetical protein